MPEMLQDGLPGPRRRSKFDFSEWADGQAWKFVKGKDYDSSTETFRYNVRRWAKANGFLVECRYVHALDKRRRELPVSKADPIGLAVRFTPAEGGSANGRPADQQRFS
jgi:hypothetical protein